VNRGQSIKTEARPENRSGFFLGRSPCRVSAGFALGVRGWGGAAPSAGGREGIDEAVDDLEDGALLGGRELGEALDALEEPGDLGIWRVAERSEPEELIGRDLEGAGELDEHRLRGLSASASRWHESVRLRGGDPVRICAGMDSNIFDAAPSVSTREESVDAKSKRLKRVRQIAKLPPRGAIRGNPSRSAQIRVANVQLPPG
jgi:hypothetical protein